MIGDSVDPLVLAAIAALSFALVVVVGGAASRRGGALALVVGAKAIAAAALVGVLVVADGWRLGAGDSVLGVLGGVPAGVGLALVLRGAASGGVARTASVAALAAAMVPVLQGLAFGVGSGFRTLTALLLALGALALLTRVAPGSGAAPTPVSEGRAPERASRLGAPVGDLVSLPGLAPGAVLGAVGGLAMGVGWSALLATYSRSGVSPAALAALTAAVAAGLVRFAVGSAWRWSPVQLALAVVLGVADAIAVVALLGAVAGATGGRATAVVVVFALWPLAAVAVAATLGELRRGSDLAALAVAALALVSLGWATAERQLARQGEQSAGRSTAEREPSQADRYRRVSMRDGAAVSRPGSRSTSR